MRHLSTAMAVAGLAALAALGPAATASAAGPALRGQATAYAVSGPALSDADHAGPGSTTQPGHQMNHQMSDGTTMGGDAEMSGSDMAGNDMSATDTSGNDTRDTDMKGMDMSGGSSATTGSDGMDEMPGMNHGARADSGTGSGHQHSQMPGTATHGEASTPPASHPRTLVIAVFAAVNGLVLLAAAMLRRRTAAVKARKRTGRAASLGATATAAGSLS
jgi:hypothetical protein